MKKVLIIGGNRFVGKTLAQILPSTEYDVTVLNRSGTKPFDKCNVIKMDRANIDNNIIHNQDIIVDMCAYTVDQVNNLLMLLNNKHHYIVISSIASEYGFFGEYGKNKAEIEKFLRFETTVPNTIIRPTYIIGNGDHHRRLDYFLDCIKSKRDIHLDQFGDKKLSFVFKEDVAKVIYKVICNGSVNKTYNVCNDENITMMELVHIFFGITQDKTNIKTLQSDAIFKDEECIFSNKLTKVDLGMKFTMLGDGIYAYIISKG